MLYPKIDTLFERDPTTFKIIPGEFTNKIYKLVREWEWTEKIDGTNIRIMYNPDLLNTKLVKDSFDTSTGNTYSVWDCITYGGKEDKSEVPEGVKDYLDETLSVDRLHSLFGEKPVTIYGEGYGAKIQTGKGYSPTQKFIAYDILVGERYWLNPYDVEDICIQLGLDVVPHLGKMEIHEAVEMLSEGFKSKLGDGSMDAEGLVGRPPIPLFDAKHRRLICKLKTCDFEKGKCLLDIKSPMFFTEGDQTPSVPLVFGRDHNNNNNLEDNND